MPDAVTGSKKGGESGTILVEDEGEKRLCGRIENSGVPPNM